MNEMARPRSQAHAHRHTHNRERDHVQRQRQVQEHEDEPDSAIQGKSHRTHQNHSQICSSHNQIPIEASEDVHDIIDDNQVGHLPPASETGQQTNNNNICVHHVSDKRYKTEPEPERHNQSDCDDYGGNGNSNSHNGISDRSNCTTGMSIQMISANGGAGAVEEPNVQHLSLATGLIVTYLIEIGIQIFLTFRCCPSLVSLFTTSTPSPTSGQSDYAWTWFLFISLSTILTSVLVTTVSIIWVCLGLDFAGRLCGRLLCYVMHFLHLGLLWRYLKLAFAYDAADIQEFIALRIFQLFIQSLPLTTLHLAWYITFQENWSGATPWLILIESASVIIAIIISSHIKQEQIQESSSSTSIELQYTVAYQRHYQHLKKKKQLDNCEKLESANNRVQILTAIPNKLMFLVGRMKTTLSLTVRAVLIYIRLILLALLIAQLVVWVPIVLLASHFFLVFTWTALTMGLHRKSHVDCDDDEAVRVQDKLELELRHRNRHHENRFCEVDLVRKVIEFCYILFWDVSFFISTSTPRISSNLNLNPDSKSKSITEPAMATMTDMNLSLWAFPICLVLLENCMGLGYIWFQRAFLPQNIQFGLLALALILGLCVVYFVGVNFLYGKCTISKLCDVSRRTPTNHVLTVPALNPTAAAAANDHRHHHCSESTSDVITPDQHQDQDQSGSGNKTVKNERSFGRSSKTITVNETKAHNGDYGRNKIISQNNEKSKLDNETDRISLNATFLSSTAVQDQQDNDDDSCDAKCRSRSRTLERNTKKSRNCLKNSNNNYIDIRSQAQSQVIMTGTSSTLGGRRKPKKAHHARGNHTDDDYGSSHEKVPKNVTSKHLSQYVRTTNSSSNLSPPEIRTYPALVSTLASGQHIDSTPSTWVPDTCCNDSNGSSSNSRNTNTLLTEFGTTGSGEKSISLLEEQDDGDDTGDDEHVFYYPKQYSPLVTPDHDEQGMSPVAAVTPSRTRKLHVHSTNNNYKHHHHRPASAAPPPRCRSSNSNHYMRKSEGGKLTPVSNASCVTMAMPFNSQTGSLQRMRTSTPVEIKKAARVIMNTSCSPNKNHSSSHVGGANNHVHRKTISSTVCESPCVVEAASSTARRVAVTGDQLSDSNKLGLLGGEKRASDGSRCTSTRPTATGHAVPSTKRSRIDHHAKPVSVSRPPAKRGIVMDPPNDSYDKLMEDSYGILICEGEETLNTTTSAGNCIDSVSACRNEKLQFHQAQGQQQQQHKKRMASSQHQAQHLMPSIFHVNKKLRVLCAKCLQNHDPLLTNCLLEEDEHGHQHQAQLNSNSGRLHYNYNNNELCLTNINNNNNASAIANSGPGSGLRRLHTPCAPSETTEYPSGTEMTWTLHDEDYDEEADDVDEDHDDDQLSGGGDDVSSSHLSNATYTTWPKSSYHPSQVQRQCQRQQQQKMSMWTTSTMLPPSMNNGTGRFPKEFTSREYVRTWLLTSGQTVKAKQNQYYHTCENSNHNCRECRPSKSNGYHTLNGSNLKRSQHMQIGPKSKHNGTRQSPPTVPPPARPNHNQNHTPSHAIASVTPDDSYYETLSTNPRQSSLNKNQLLLLERHKNKRPMHSLSPPSPASIPVREINEPDNNINELSFNQRRRSEISNTVTVTQGDAHANESALYRPRHEVQVDVEVIPEEFGVDVGVGVGKDLEIIV